MPVATDEIDAIRHACGKAMLDALVIEPFEAIDRALVIEQATADPDIAMRLFPDCATMVAQGLGDGDEAILLKLMADFAADADASPHDKILEGLMARFEYYAPYRPAFRHLSRAAMKNPMLGGMLIYALNRASQGLLNLAGVDTTGAKGAMRIKGLTLVAVLCQKDWLNDTSGDLSATLRALDNRLKQAESLASTLGILGEGGGNDPENDPENDPGQH